MLKAEKFNAISAKGIKDVKEFSVLDHVKTAVRTAELKKAEANKSFKDYVKTLEDSHANLDAMTCDEATILEVLKTDAGDFIKLRKEVLDLRKEVSELAVSAEELASLSPVDRLHITLIAHTIYSGVLVSEDLFDAEKGGVDLSKAIKIFYSKGTVTSELKDNLKAVFNKILNNEGDYFYAIKPARADFEKSDIIHFLTRFSGKARKEERKNKETGAISYSNFNYNLRTDKKTQCRAFTEFCAVIIDNASKHSVIKNENESEEKTA